MGSDDPLPDPPSAATDDVVETGPSRWDANDANRRDDAFAPPQEPCECHCLHCGRVFTSDGIWFQKVINDPTGFTGFWMCPTPNCVGAGFTFDIFPTDPNHPANDGWVSCDDEDDDEEFCEDDEVAGEGGEWDPDEPKYKALDEAFGDEDDDDIEGEEWKYGLQPGEEPPEPQWAEQARREWEQEQKKYDEPDERPRVVDWSDRQERRDPGRPQFNDDDIPF